MPCWTATLLRRADRSAAPRALQIAGVEELLAVASGRDLRQPDLRRALADRSLNDASVPPQGPTTTAIP